MKLGFLAMSGVRAHEPELTALGLTLPGFVERNKVIASLPSLGLLTLAGATRPDLDVDYVEVPDVLPAPWLPGEFDAVAISSFSAQMKEAYELADRYRAAGTKVILGGLHVTALPQEAAMHADAIVLGEREPLWPRVVDDLLRGALEPVYDARPIKFDLANAPMPRYELLDVEKYMRTSVFSMKTPVFSVKLPVFSMKTPVFSMKTLVVSVKTPVVSMKTPVVSMKTPVFSMKTSVLSVKTSVFSMKTPVFSVKTTVLSMKTTVFSGGHRRRRRPDCNG